MPVINNYTAAVTAIKSLGSLGPVTSVEATIYGTSTPTFILEYSTTGNVGSWISAGAASTNVTVGLWSTVTWTGLSVGSTLFWRLSATTTTATQAEIRVGDFRVFNGAVEWAEGAVQPPAAGTSARLELGLSKDGGVSIAGSRTINVLGTLQAFTVGGVADLFGAIWTRDDVNSNTFALAIRRPILGDEDGSLSRLLDTVALDVYYTPEGASLMALERQFSTQKILIGKEVTPGTLVATPTRLMGVTANASPKGEWRSWSPTGDKLDTLQMLIKEWTECQLDGIPTYDELGYVLNAALNLDAPSLIATGAYNHRWYFNARSANTVQTYSMSYGDPEDATRAHQFTFGYVNYFDLDFDRTKADLKANMLGQALTDGITMTVGANQVWGITSTATGGTVVYSYKGARTTALAFGATTAAVQTALQALSTVGAGNMLVTGTAAALVITAAGALAGQNLPNIEMPASGMLLTGGTSTQTVTTPGGYTEATLMPILPGQLGIYVGSTYSTLSSSKLTRAFVSKVSFKGMRSPVWVLDPANSSFGATIEPEAKIEITIMVEADSNGMAFLTNARTGTQMYVRLLATGPLIGATAINYSFQLDACAKISALPPYSDKDGVYACEYKFTVDHDTTQGFSTYINLVNQIAAY